MPAELRARGGSSALAHGSLSGRLARRALGVRLGARLRNFEFGLGDRLRPPVGGTGRGLLRGNGSLLMADARPQRAASCLLGGRRLRGHGGLFGADFLVLAGTSFSHGFTVLVRVLHKFLAQNAQRLNG